MVSEKFALNSDAERMAAARYATEDFAKQIGLGKKNMLRLNLLVEETLGMMKAMVDEFYGQLWFENKGKSCEIHLEATAKMDSNRKHDLLSVSSTGKNAASKGFMAMIGDFISNVLYAYGEETIRYGIIHTEAPVMPATGELQPIWTLHAYREDLERERRASSEAGEAWDELEKSIVANLADDVIVGVKGDRIEMVIARDFGR